MCERSNISPRTLWAFSRRTACKVSKSWCHAIRGWTSPCENRDNCPLCSSKSTTRSQKRVQDTKRIPNIIQHWRQSSNIVQNRQQRFNIVNPDGWKSLSIVQDGRCIFGIIRQYERCSVNFSGRVNWTVDFLITNRDWLYQQKKHSEWI